MLSCPTASAGVDWQSQTIPATSSMLDTIGCSRKSQEIPLTYDEALNKNIGQFGPGQWKTLLWASIPQIANAAAFFLWVFITVDTVSNRSWRCTDPSDAVCAAVWQQDSPSSQGFCSLRPHQWQWTSQDSLVAKFNLVCSDAWKVQFTNSLMFMGAFLGSGLFGFLCDRWGRRRPLFLATALVAASMFASLGTPSYWVMAALRAVTGIGAAGQAHCMFLLSTEPVGPDFRGFAAIASLTLFAVGEFLMVALAYALPVWQHLVLAAACVNVAALLLYPIVSESARWLLSQGRTEEAMVILQRIARGNKSSMPAQALVCSNSRKQLQPTLEAIAEEGLCSDEARQSVASDDAASESGGSLGLCQLLKERRLAIRLVVLLINWFSLMLNYYGIAMGSGGIPGSIHLTFAIGVVAEVIALLVVGPTVDRLGRHNIVALGQLLGGGACLACAMVTGGTTQAVLAGIGKFGCSAAESVISIYTAELLPTSCRSSIMGICSQASRLGSICAPFLLMLGAQLGSVGGYTQVFIPFMVFGCLAVLGGLLTLLMPETLGAAMPEHVEDLNNLLSAFTAKPWRHGCTHLFAFIFRTKAAAAYNPRTNSIMRTCCASKAVLQAAAAIVAAEPVDGKTVETKQAFDSRRVADADRKASLYGDDSELSAGVGEAEHSCAVTVTVHADRAENQAD